MGTAATVPPPRKLLQHPRPHHHEHARSGAPFKAADTDSCPPWPLLAPQAAAQSSVFVFSVRRRANQTPAAMILVVRSGLHPTPYLSLAQVLRELFPSTPRSTLQSAVAAVPASAAEVAAYQQHSRVKITNGQLALFELRQLIAFGDARHWPSTAMRADLLRVLTEGTDSFQPLALPVPRPFPLPGHDAQQAPQVGPCLLAAAACVAAI